MDRQSFLRSTTSFERSERVVPLERSSRQPAIRALLAVSDAAQRTAYAQYLRGSGYEINEAEDGGEALAKALARLFDVVVADVSLSGIDGGQLCALLRYDRQTQSMPIIVLTPSGDPAGLERMRQAGANAVLVEPLGPETLLAEMRRLVASPDCVVSAMTGRAFLAARDAAEPGGQRGPSTGKRPLSRAHLRHRTTTPAIAPPTLVCPECDRRLVYLHSHIGGVNAYHTEQWDYYKCPSTCGSFQYRHRTRRLRRL